VQEPAGGCVEKNRAVSRRIATVVEKQQKNLFFTKTANREAGLKRVSVRSTA